MTKGTNHTYNLQIYNHINKTPFMSHSNTFYTSHMKHQYMIQNLVMPLIVTEVNPQGTLFFVGKRFNTERSVRNHQ